MTKSCEIEVVDFEQYTDMDYREVSSFWIKNCLGQKVYFKTRSREVAVYTCDQLYGKGHYQVSSGKMGKKSDNESAVGRLGSKSRQGLRTKGY
jgi:hypothetical protein